MNECTDPPGKYASVPPLLLHQAPGTGRRHPYPPKLTFWEEEKHVKDSYTYDKKAIRGLPGGRVGARAGLPEGPMRAEPWEAHRGWLGTKLVGLLRLPPLINLPNCHLVQGEVTNPRAPGQAGGADAEPPTQLLSPSPWSSAGEAASLKPRFSGSASSQVGVRRPLAKLAALGAAASPRLPGLVVAGWCPGGGVTVALLGRAGRRGQGPGVQRHPCPTWPARGHVDVGEKSPSPCYLGCRGSRCPR